MIDTVQHPEGALLFSTLCPEIRELVEQVQATKQPLRIERDGAGAAVLVDAESFDQLQRRAALQQLVLEGKQGVAAGRLHTQEEVEAMMDEWFSDRK